MSARVFVLGLCTSVVLLAGAVDASGQIVINAGDEVNFRLGLLGQFQAESIDDPGTDAQTNNLFVRRLRLMFGGQVTKNVTFFVETDTPNLGKTMPTGKNLPGAMIIQDAYAEFKVTDAFAVDAGLMFIPFSRNFLQSAASLLPIDYGAYTYTQSGPTQSSTGRDTGFQAKGYVLNNHLDTGSEPFRGRGIRHHTAHSVMPAACSTTCSIPKSASSTRGRTWARRKIVSVGARSTFRATITATTSTSSSTIRSARER